MIQELTQQELLTKAEQTAGPFAVFLYTPFCGTCKLTERMLEIVLQTEPAIPIFKGNINFMPVVSRQWQITSVPCIVMIHSDGNKQFMYRMKSIDDLYKQLKQLV